MTIPTTDEILNSDLTGFEKTMTLSALNDYLIKLSDALAKESKAIREQAIAVYGVKEDFNKTPESDEGWPTDYNYELYRYKYLAALMKQINA